MPYKHEWLIEGQVIFAEIWGEQTMDELVESNEALLRFLNQADNRLIHIMLTDVQLKSIPTSLVQLQKVLTYTKHPNMGWAVLFGEKEQGIKESAQDFIIVMLAKLTRARYIRFKTFNEAIDHLKRVDQSIDWDAVNTGLIKAL